MVITCFLKDLSLNTEKVVRKHKGIAPQAPPEWPALLGIITLWAEFRASPDLEFDYFGKTRP